MSSFKFDEGVFRRKIGEAVGKAKVDVPCPECSAKNPVVLDDISMQRVITCRGCSKTIKLIDEGGGFKKIVEGR